MPHPCWRHHLSLEGAIMRASGPAGINLSSRNLPVSGTCLAGLLKRTTTMSLHHDSLTRAAAWIAAADSLIITAGAGMGVDSGLPDFRGPQGFWKAYPALSKHKLQSRTSPLPHPSVPDHAWPGAFTAIVWSCIGIQCRIPALHC